MPRNAGGRRQALHLRTLDFTRFATWTLMADVLGMNMLFKLKYASLFCRLNSRSQTYFRVLGLGLWSAGYSVSVSPPSPLPTISLLRPAGLPPCTADRADTAHSCSAPSHSPPSWVANDNTAAAVAICLSVTAPRLLPPVVCLMPRLTAFCSGGPRGEVNTRSMKTSLPVTVHRFISGNSFDSCQLSTSEG